MRTILARLYALFRPKKAEGQTDTQRKEPALVGGIFSTTLPAVMPAGAALARAQQMSIQKTPEDFKMAPGFAMDSNSFPGIKTAFMLGQSGVPDAQLYWYGSQGFIGYQICAVLAQHWLIDKACTMPGRDALRKGYDVTVNNGDKLTPDVLDYIRQRDKDYAVKRNCEQFSRFARIFGVRIAIFLVESSDPAYYERPFNPDAITPNSYRGISQVDPYWITPELSTVASSDPAAKDFYEPTWWRIGAKRYHRSHLVLFRYSEVADVLKPSYIYGGVSLVQHIYERVYCAERTANEAPQLALTKRTTVLKTDTTKAAGNQREFEENLTRWIQWRDNYAVKVIDNSEELTETDTALSELDAVIMTQYQLVAAVARVPSTKLLGTTPKGFQATGEYESTDYREEMETVQTHEHQPLLERHYLCLWRSEIAPCYSLDPRTGLTVVFKPLDSPTAKDQAAINYQNAQTAEIYVQIGATNGAEERARLVAAPESGYTMLGPTVDEAGSGM